MSDLERNLVADRLSEAFGSGQLTREEFEHRVSRALDARTDLIWRCSPPACGNRSSPVRSAYRAGWWSISAADLVIAAVMLFVIGIVGLWVADVARYSDSGWLLVWIFGAASAGLGAFITGNRRRKL